MVGASGGATYFSPELAPSLFGGNSFGDQGGYYLNIGNGCCSTALANAGGSANFSGPRSLDARDRGHGELAQGQAQPQLRRLVDARRRCGCRTRQMVPELRFGIVDRRPGGGHVHDGELPGRVERRS